MGSGKEAHMAAVADLTLSVIPSPLTRPVLSGQFAPPGVVLHTQEARSVDDNSRRMLDLAFDVGEMSLAWLTLIGAAVGIQQRAHFTLHVFTHKLAPAAQLWIHRFNHALIVGVGILAAWYGYQLCLLNRTLATPGLQLNLAWLYASALIGGILIAVYGLAMLVSPPPQDEPLHGLE